MLKNTRTQSQVCDKHFHVQSFTTCIFFYADIYRKHVDDTINSYHHRYDFFIAQNVTSVYSINKVVIVCINGIIIIIITDVNICITSLKNSAGFVIQ